MDCLLILILAFLFRGVIYGILAWLIEVAITLYRSCSVWDSGVLSLCSYCAQS